MRLFENTNIDFLGKRKKFYLVSTIIIILGVIALFIKPIPLGIDFIGGTEIQLRFQTPVEVSDVRNIMEDAGFGAMEIKTMGSESDILLRTPMQGEGQSVSDRIQDAIKAGIPENTFEVLRVDKVGPKIGEELRRNALLAIIF